MKERAKLVVKIVVLLIFIVVFSFGYYSHKRNIQISLTGGKDEATAVRISQNEIIEVKVFIEKNDRMKGIYFYWDDNEEEKQKLNNGIFIARAKIDVPKTVGVHKLTIETGVIKIKYNYYYEVVKGKSE